MPCCRAEEVHRRAEEVQDRLERMSTGKDFARSCLPLFVPSVLPRAFVAEVSEVCFAI